MAGVITVLSVTTMVELCEHLEYLEEHFTSGRSEPWPVFLASFGFAIAEMDEVTPSRMHAALTAAADRSGIRGDMTDNSHRIAGRRRANRRTMSRELVQASRTLFEVALAFKFDEITATAGPVDELDDETVAALQAEFYAAEEQIRHSFEALHDPTHWAQILG